MDEKGARDRGGERAARGGGQAERRAREAARRAAEEAAIRALSDDEGADGERRAGAALRARQARACGARPCVRAGARARAGTTTASLLVYAADRLLACLDGEADPHEPAPSRRAAAARLRARRRHARERRGRRRARPGERRAQCAPCRRRARPTGDAFRRGARAAPDPHVHALDDWTGWLSPSTPRAHARGGGAAGVEARWREREREAAAAAAAEVARSALARRGARGGGRPRRLSRAARSAARAKEPRLGRRPRRVCRGRRRRQRRPARLLRRHVRCRRRSPRLSASGSVAGSGGGRRSRTTREYCTERHRSKACGPAIKTRASRRLRRGPGGSMAASIPRLGSWPYGCCNC